MGRVFCCFASVLWVSIFVVGAQLANAAEGVAPMPPEADRLLARDLDLSADGRLNNRFYFTVAYSMQLEQGAEQQRGDVVVCSDADGRALLARNADGSIHYLIRDGLLAFPDETNPQLLRIRRGGWASFVLRR
jgi:hypothetical protein